MFPHSSKAAKRRLHTPRGEAEEIASTINSPAMHLWNRGTAEIDFVFIPLEI